MVTLQQVEALKNGRIDIGFGRIYIDDPAVVQKVIRQDPLVAALPAGHHLLGAPVSLAQLAQEPFVLYPGNVRPSYADHVLKLFSRQDLKIRVVQMTNELQTAIGLVAAGIGITLVPASVQRLHRDDIGFTPLLDPLATSPIIVSYRAGDESALLQQCLGWIAELGASQSA
jgi:DNA-binding transcriptional LysR family regulator